MKSCLLLAGLLAEGPTAVIEQRPTRDHTERMLRAAGASVTTENAGTPVTIHGELPAQRVTVEPAARLEPGEIVVPGGLLLGRLPARRRGDRRAAARYGSSASASTRAGSGCSGS